MPCVPRQRQWRSRPLIPAVATPAAPLTAPLHRSCARLPPPARARQHPWRKHCSASCDASRTAAASAAQAQLAASCPLALPCSCRCCRQGVERPVPKRSAAADQQQQYHHHDHRRNPGSGPRTLARNIHARTRTCNHLTHAPSSAAINTPAPKPVQAGGFCVCSSCSIRTQPVPRALQLAPSRRTAAGSRGRARMHAPTDRRACAQPSRQRKCCGTGKRQ